MHLIPTIGLEVHLQLNTESKMFCSCSNRGETSPPNTTICPICLAHPGTLPTINSKAIEHVVKAGLALNCTISQSSKLDRKNYFYPDLPKGYQISQYDAPLCQHGYLEINGLHIRIRRIHIEEDTAKLFHTDDKQSTLVDFNRAGSPLMELVTEPDFTSAQEAKIFCQELQRIFRVLDISDADMEKGHMRCEANISIRLEGTDTLGTKVEVKNINSFRAVEKAILYEITRQEECLEQKKQILQETRGWDDIHQCTKSQRSKEDAHDYRYFPEPDLPPMELTEEHMNALKKTLPELPLAKRQRFQKEYGFSEEAALLLTEEKRLSSWTEQVVSELRLWLKDFEQPVNEEENWTNKKPSLMRLVSGWITTELFKLMKEYKVPFDDIKITPENFAEFLTYVFVGKVNTTSAQFLLQEMFHHGSDPSHIMQEKNLAQIENEQQLSAIAEHIIEKFPTQVAQYKKGKITVIQFLIGQVMRASEGKAHPEKVKELLLKKLS